MTFRVYIDFCANETVWRAYATSCKDFKDSRTSFWDAYKAENNVELVDGYLVFESEAHFTWFMLRWS